MNGKLDRFNLLYEQIKALLTENADGFQSVEEFVKAVCEKGSEEDLKKDEELKHKIKCTSSDIATKAYEEILLKANEGGETNASLNAKSMFIQEIINRNE